MHDKPSLSASGVFYRHNPSVNDISLLYALLPEAGSIDEYWQVILASLEITFQVISQAQGLPGIKTPTYRSAVNNIKTFAKLVEARKHINSLAIPITGNGEKNMKRFLDSKFRPIRVIANYVVMRQNNTPENFPEVLLQEYPQFVPHEHSFGSPDLFAQYVCSYWFTSELDESSRQQHKIMLAEHLQRTAERVDARRRNALFGFFVVVAMTFIGGLFLYSRVAGTGPDSHHSWYQQSR